MKVYCRECGAKIEFLVKSKPKFCHGCGIPLGLESTTATIEHEKMREEGLQKLPDIEGLDFDFVPNRITGEKMESIIGTSPGGNAKEEPRLVNDQSREDFLNEFKKEAGSLREQKKSPDNPK